MTLAVAYQLVVNTFVSVGRRLLAFSLQSPTPKISLPLPVRSKHILCFDHKVTSLVRSTPGQTNNRHPVKQTTDTRSNEQQTPGQANNRHPVKRTTETANRSRLLCYQTSERLKKERKGKTPRASGLGRTVTKI